jgi:gliding motility-associated-like protein
VPNTFTPDGDHHNNEFKPILTDGFDPQGYTLYIFNRWGQIVFESHDTAFGWNGFFGLGGDKAQDGTYTWKIEVKEENTPKVHLFTGHVNLLR